MHITPEQKDVLTELVNIDIGRADATLNSLIGHKIRLLVPDIEIVSMANVITHPQLFNMELSA